MAMVSSLALPSSVPSPHAPPHVLVFVDANMTITLRDSRRSAVKVDDRISGLLAENFRARWDHTCDVPCTYASWVRSRSGSCESEEAKRAFCATRIHGFRTWVDEHKEDILPSILEKIVETDRTVRSKIFGGPCAVVGSADGAEVGKNIFPSFLRMIERLKDSGLQFTVVIRSMGDDLESQPGGPPTLLEELRTHPMLHDSDVEIPPTISGYFESGNLHWHGSGSSGIRTLSKIAEIRDLFLSMPRSIIAVKDDFRHWNTGKRRIECGKPFGFAPSELRFAPSVLPWLGDRGHLPGVEGERPVLSFFIDDSYNEGPMSIIRPQLTTDELDVPALDLSTTLRDIKFFQANALAAITDDEYFVDIVNTAARAHGFAHFNLAKLAMSRALMEQIRALARDTH